MTAIPRGECDRCRMGYRIQTRPHGGNGGGKLAERTRCGECKLPFWHTVRNIETGEAVAIVGVEPDDLQNWRLGQ